jgi:hypothetical protein
MIKAALYNTFLRQGKLFIRLNCSLLLIPELRFTLRYCKAGARGRIVEIEISEKGSWNTQLLHIVRQMLALNISFDFGTISIESNERSLYYDPDNRNRTQS